MKAMLFAAGLGTRLKPYTEKIPKALAPIGNSTLLATNLLYLQKHGIFDVVVNVHHFPQLITDYLAANNNFGSTITISDETDMLLETGGGLLKAMPHFVDDAFFVVMNVDILTNLDLRELIIWHTTRLPLATLAVMERSSTRQLIFNNDMELTGWRNKNTGEEKIATVNDQPKEFAFSGVQVISPKIWDYCTLKGKFSLIDVYLMVAQQQLIQGFNHTGDTFLDVGKPESLEQANELFTKDSA